MPKVSVIVISYNMARLVTRAIQSIFSQTFRDYEILFVDDGSTDDTKQVVESFGDRVRYFYQENAGLAAARNRGILASRGEYIAFLDSDDYWVPDKLEVQVAVLDKNPRVGLVHARALVVNEEGKPRGFMPVKRPGRTFREIIEVGAFFPVCSVMVRKECFIKAGICNADVVNVEDTDMWLRVARHCDIYEVEGRHLSYYYREDSRKPRGGIRQYKSQVRLYRRILSSYEDIPHKAVKRKLAMFEYLLGKSYRQEGQWRQALTHIASAMFQYPAVEASLFFGTESSLKKLFKLLRPYVLLLQCVFLCPFSKKASNFAGDR